MNVLKELPIREKAVKLNADLQKHKVFYSRITMNYKNILSIIQSMKKMRIKHFQTLMNQDQHNPKRQVFQEILNPEKEFKQLNKKVNGLYGVMTCNLSFLCRQKVKPKMILVLI